MSGTADQAADGALGEAINRVTQNPDPLRIAVLVGRARREAPESVADGLREARSLTGDLDDPETQSEFVEICERAREQLNGDDA